MITLDDIKGRSTINLLTVYTGKNPYILKFKRELENKGKITLTDNQTKYIRDNSDKEPIRINRIIRITPYLGEQLQKIDDITFVPEKIFVEYLLAETDKAFHIQGKTKVNQKEPKLYFLPKTQLLDDLFFEEIDVDIDFDNYIKLDKLSRTPFVHQKQGSKFLVSRTHCILADDMGLGPAKHIRL